MESFRLEKVFKKEEAFASLIALDAVIYQTIPKIVFSVSHHHKECFG